MRQVVSLQPSSLAMLQVVDYAPTEGDPGVPISATLHYSPPSSGSVYLRLVVGNKAVGTQVRREPNGLWQLDATAPAIDKDSFAADRVPIAVQVLNSENAVLDSQTFGEFTYWLSDIPSPKPNTSSLKQETLSDDVLLAQSTPTTRRRATTISQPIHSSTPTSERAPPPKPRPKSQQFGQRRIVPNALVRSKFPPFSAEQYQDLHPQPPILTIATSLDSMCTGWDPAEVACGRRLVKFHKVQDGRELIISCEPIRQEDYHHDIDLVISCIYRQDTDNCWVTSVDIIYLLERLANTEFPVEEKNRIRRNLEGLRPTTVSKHKHGFAAFFQRIMEFPDPKPRNIEKDLKVFEWTLLGQALEKILSKYSVYTSSPTDSTLSLPLEYHSDSSQFSGPQLSYPVEVDPHANGTSPFIKPEYMQESLFSQDLAPEPLSYDPYLAIKPQEAQDPVNADFFSDFYASVGMEGIDSSTQPTHPFEECNLDLVPKNSFGESMIA